MGCTSNNGYLLRRLALFIGLCGGLGGISIDLDHLLNMATGEVVPWSMFHAPVVALALAIFCSGCLVTLIGGLFSALVLGYGQKRGQSFPSV